MFNKNKREDIKEKKDKITIPVRHFQKVVCRLNLPTKKCSCGEEVLDSPSNRVFLDINNKMKYNINDFSQIMLDFISQKEKYFNERMIVWLPSKEAIFDQDGNDTGRSIDAFVGFTDGKRFSINNLIYLDYKDSYQLGTERIIFDTEKELRYFCKLNNINVWEYYRCAKCDETLFGSFTIDDSKYICTGCAEI